MSEAEPLLQVIDEWWADRLAREALDYENPALVVALAQDVITAELVRRCLIDEPSARRIAAALVREASAALTCGRKASTVH
jgi:hypothetical protein